MKKVDRLSEEATKALAAGMSYGKWKAMQNPTVIEEPPKIGIVKICKHCGKAFTQYDKRNRLYCGDRCRIATNQKLRCERKDNNESDA